MAGGSAGGATPASRSERESLDVLGLALGATKVRIPVAEVFTMPTVLKHFNPRVIAVQADILLFLGVRVVVKAHV